MSAAWDFIARAFVGFVFGPLDRTACAWANHTHGGAA